jgi:hypothetical protein
MGSSHGTKSIILFVFSVISLLLLTFFESSLSGLTASVERLISLLLLVLPGLAGVVFGVLGVVKKEPRKWIAISGVLINGLFAAFMTFVLSFAG